jgi:hypothetical protein
MIDCVVFNLYNKDFLKTTLRLSMQFGHFFFFLACSLDAVILSSHVRRMFHPLGIVMYKVIHKSL